MPKLFICNIIFMINLYGYRIIFLIYNSFTMAYQNFKRNEVGSFKNKCFLSIFKAKESIRSPPLPNFLPSKRKIKESPTTKELTFFFFFAKHKRACARRVGTHVLKAKSSRSYEVDGVMFCMCFTLFFIKRTKAQIFSTPYLYPVLRKL